jgi:hypothetical protein
MNEIHSVLDKVLADNKRAETVVTEKQIQEIMFMTYGYSYDETRRAQEVMQKTLKAHEAERQRDENEAENYWLDRANDAKKGFDKPYEKWSINNATTADWDAVRPDNINSPPHYTFGGIETIDFIAAKLSPEEYRGYLKGNLLKYASRIGKKGEDDAGKAAWYAKHLELL